MRYLSLFSGIDAATQALHPLGGFEPAAFSEIEPHPCAVLKHRFPHVPNLGDITKHKEWPDIGTIDLICGGSPCQSFSVAGLRKGMDDPRGNLLLSYLAVVDQYRPRWVLYENVPGILSSNGGRDFGAFLGALGQLGYGFAYRVLDAQYVRTRSKRRAVPQRRRRVFVVGYLGDWRRAAAVLFDAESLRRDPPPRREAGQGVAPTIASRPTGGGGLGTDFDCDGGLIASHEAAQPLLAKANSSHRADAESYVAVDTSHLPEVCNALAARDSKQPRAEDNVGIIAVRHMAVAPTLRGEGFDATDDGTGKGTPIIPVCFDSKGSQVQIDETGAAPTLRAMTHADSHQNGGGQLAVAFDTTQITSPTNASNPQPGDPCHTLAKGGHAPAVAYDMRGREGGAQLEGPHDTANLRAADGGSSRSYVAQPWAVRRLTPRECERLMGMEDDFTNVPWRGKAFSPDGNRYKELGNSWALNCIEWIGERMLIVDAWD